MYSNCLPSSTKRDNINNMLVGECFIYCIKCHCGKISKCNNSSDHTIWRVQEDSHRCVIHVSQGIHLVMGVHLSPIAGSTWGTNGHKGTSGRVVTHGCHVVIGVHVVAGGLSIIAVARTVCVSCARHRGTSAGGSRCTAAAWR